MFCKMLLSMIISRKAEEVTFINRPNNRTKKKSLSDIVPSSFLSLPYDVFQPKKKERVLRKKETLDIDQILCLCLPRAYIVIKYINKP